MKVWVQTYFETTRYGTTVEKERIYGASLHLHEVRKIADRFIVNQRSKGRAILPQYDLYQEQRA